MKALITLLNNRVDGRVSSMDLAIIFISMGGDSGGGGGVIFVLNNKENCAVDYRGWRMRSARISDLLCDEALGLWRASSYNHNDAMNDRDDDEEASWEPT